MSSNCATFTTANTVWTDADSAERGQGATQAGFIYGEYFGGPVDGGAWGERWKAKRLAESQAPRLVTD